MKNTVQSRYLNVCRQIEKADIVLKNARIINVFSKEIIAGDIAIVADKIVGIGSYKGIEEWDMEGRFVAPGLIDSHVHIESSMVSPQEFAKTVLPHGTTTIIADPHEIGNVAGVAGIEYMLMCSKEAVIPIFYMLPSCVPATDMESSGAVLDAETLQSLIDHPQILGLGEVMNFPGVILGDEGVLAKLDMAKHKVIDGHAPCLDSYDLMAYALAGIHTDHECSTAKEALDRIRLGMTVQIRKGSAANNLAAIIAGLLEEKIGFTNCVFCTDDKHLEDIFTDGHINSNVRESIALGVDPVEAICMGTIYPAKLYGLNHLGAVAPGYAANLIVLDDLNTMEVASVMVGGAWKYGKEYEPVGVATTTFNRYTTQVDMFHSMHVKPFEKEALQIFLEDATAHVIGIIGHQILTDKLQEEVPTQKGYFVANESYSKLAVVERHHATGNIGLGITKGFGIKGGAIAQTVAHDSHNIICIGDNDEDMFLAIQTLIDKQGGIVVVKEGKIASMLQLPIAGLMSTLSAVQVTSQLKELLSIAQSLEINPEIDPFLTLAFLALPVIPALKLTDRGLFDVGAFQHITVGV